MSQKDENVISFRLDCNESIGAGHLYRCLSLADALVRKGKRCEFVVREFSHEFVQLAKDEGHDVIVLSNEQFVPKRARSEKDYRTWLGAKAKDDVKDFLSVSTGKVVIVDHYGIDSEWLRSVKSDSRTIVVIDDGGKLDNYPVDMILNPTQGFPKEKYYNKISESVNLIVGPPAVLLREDWLRFREKYTLKTEIKNIAFCPGGADPFQTTENILIPLAQANPSYDFTAFFRANDERQERLIKLASKLSNLSFVFDSTSLSQPLSCHDLVIGSAGSGSWERCCLGIPQIIIRTTIDQHHIAEALRDLGSALVVDAGDKNVVEQLSNFLSTLDNDLEMRLRMSSISRELIDGQSAENVAELITNMVRV